MKKMMMPILLGAALAIGCAAPALAAPPQQYQSDQDRDRQRNTQAYDDGYAQGQADARAHAIRNNQATSQWTKDDDTRAYRQGYDAGFDNIANAAREPAGESRLGHPDQQAEQFGYQDGLAAGRNDVRKGDKFKPEDHDFYKDADRGWTASLGTKDNYKQFYRQGFVRGYEEGYKGIASR
jgi:opacity protein-like surface antigen